MGPRCLVSTDHTQPERHPLGRRQGLPGLGRAGRRRLYGRAGDQGPGRRPSPAASSASPACDGHFHYAQKKGYSGVGLYTAQGAQRRHRRLRPRGVRRRGPLRRGPLRHRRGASSASSAATSPAAPAATSARRPSSASWRASTRTWPSCKAEREFILVGDVNIAHKEIDLKNWKGNQKNSGFLPEERAWMTTLLDRRSAWSTCSARSTRQPEQYTWWSNRGQALGQERRLAARLPPGHAGHRREGQARADLPGPALLATTRR